MLMSKAPDADHRVRRSLTFSTLQGALCVLAFVATSMGAAAQPLSLDVLLPRMFAFVDQFEREFGSMVAEERYEQTVRQAAFSRGETRRVLRSDFLLVKVAGQGWLPFRDVFEADGRQLRDREDRLTTLFLSGATTDVLAQARRIMDEGARYNLGEGTRNINVPTLVLMYLSPETRSGMRFADTRSDGAAEGRVIEFSELRRPTLIGTTGGRDLPARGRIWVDEATGTINRTELHAGDTGIEAEVTVSFGLDSALNTWVPKRMDDRFKRRGGTSEVRGVATYSRFRRFQVSTSEELAPPEPDRKP
jgi:hypothetical protein